MQSRRFPVLLWQQACAIGYRLLIDFSLSVHLYLTSPALPGAGGYSAFRRLGHFCVEYTLENHVERNTGDADLVLGRHQHETGIEQTEVDVVKIVS